MVHWTAGATGNFLPSGQTPAGGTYVMMPYTRASTPPYSMSRIKYFNTVNAMAQAWLLKGFASAGISPVLGSTPIVSPVNNGITQTTNVISKIAYVQKYMQIWHHSGGLPLFLVSWFTRILKAKSRLASIGAKATVKVAVCRIFWMGRLSYFSPKPSAAMRQMASAVYISMNWIVRLTTHCIAVGTPWFVLNCDPTTGTCFTAPTASNGSPCSMNFCESRACAVAAATQISTATLMVARFVRLSSLTA